jgi:hypothetical protein
LARNLANPYLGHEPKSRVTTLIPLTLKGHNFLISNSFLTIFSALDVPNIKKCNEKKKKQLEHDKKRKQLNNNPKMKNLKFFTCKRHNAFI